MKARQIQNSGNKWATRAKGGAKSNAGWIRTDKKKERNDRKSKVTTKRPFEKRKIQETEKEEEERMQYTPQ